jgi:CheY-like chemotaxis protein
LRQILVNLLSNAVKFTDRGEVSLSVTRAEAGGSNLIEFTIADQGIGIPEDRLASIFEEFSQADSSITRKYGGTGLGLSISRRLVERMGGRIWVMSSLGRGSVFRFTAGLEPSALAPEPRESISDTLPADSPERALRILVAEDKVDNQFVVELYLRALPHALTFVGDGQSAVERFGAETYDLVLMDVQMPVLDGLSATRTIRAMEEQRGICPTPIIAVTADAGPEDVARCRAAGCTEHLAKPISRSRLLTTIRRYSQPHSGAAAVAEENPLPPEVKALLKGLVPGYLAGRGEDAQKLIQLAAERDFQQIRALAHQIKGSGSTYGFPGLTTLAGSVESAAKAEDSVRVDEQAKELIRFIARAVEGLRG